MLNGRQRKAHFICKGLIATESEEPSMIHCNIKSTTFKGLLRHLRKKHLFYIPDNIVCYNCEKILSSTCQVIQHFASHTEKAIEVFSLENDEEECQSCKTNIDCIKMIRPGMNCHL